MSLQHSKHQIVNPDLRARWVLPQVGCKIFVSLTAHIEKTPSCEGVFSIALIM